MKVTLAASVVTVLSCLQLAWAQEYKEVEPDFGLEPRQNLGQVPGAVQDPLQVSPVTTFFMNIPVGTTVTWEGTPYTQTFAAIPDQLPSPGVGQIGWGTLKAAGASKRDAEAEPEVTPAPQGIAGRVRW